MSPLSGNDLTRKFMRVLGKVPRVSVVRVLAQGPASSVALAARLSMPERKLAKHLQVMHEQGVLELEGNLYRLSHKIRVTSDQERHYVEFRTSSRTGMTLGLRHLSH